MVVLVSPLPRQHPRLQQAAELLGVEELVPQPAVERLRVPVLPRRARRDVQHLDRLLLQPAADRLRDELRAVVAADVPRRAAPADQRREHGDDRTRRQRPPDLQRQALAGVLVHHAQPLQRLAVGRPVVDEVPTPHVIAALGPAPDTAVGTRTEPPLLSLLLRDFQALPPPEPVDPLAVDPPALPPQQRPDPAVAEPRVPPDQRQHPPHQPPLVRPRRRAEPLGRAGLAHDPTGPPLRYSEARPQAVRRPAPLGRRQNFPRTTSSSICLSRDNSATSFFSRAFSASSSFTRSAWSARPLPYCCRQRQNVGSLTPSFWQTWPTVIPPAKSSSAARILRTICSGVCRLPMESLLPARGPRDSHSTWTTFWGADQIQTNTSC